MPRLHLVRLEFGQVYLWRDGDELTLIDAGLTGSGPAIVTGALPVPPPVFTDVDRDIWARLSDGDGLDFGDGAVAVGAAGHTTGSIGVHLPRHGILFTGAMLP